jgi:hypothetical protein
MLPLVPETEIGYPSTDAPRVPLTPIDIELAVGARATVTTATLPSGIVFVFSPLVKQMYAVPPPTQLMLLPADVIAALGVTEKLVTLADG